jgi:hypothetical protein
MNNSQYKENIAITQGARVDETIEKVDGAKYLYVMAKTGNNYSKIVEYDIDDNQKQQTPQKPADNTDAKDNQNDDSGLFDYEFGELILIILVIVLIVSCALIITQKIVDYKKRLY